jgi:predicted nucleotidyltransferase component of viral defense system
VGAPAHTLLLDPVSQRPAHSPFKVQVLSLRETYAEKIRAALSRTEPAIRDFFDLHHALTTERITLDCEMLRALVRDKLDARFVGKAPIVSLSEEKRRILAAQIETNLKPVLRAADLAKFDLERVVEQLRVFEGT